ncbi:MAG: HEPN domain-containing protein [Elusimicrobiota bacterium]
MKDNRQKLTEEWVIKAQNDLEAAEILYNEEGSPDTLAFHCHQSVEKFLKAYLVFGNMHFEKIHNLWKLANLGAIKDKEFLEFEEELKTLDAYYIESRYPPEIRSYTREEAKQILCFAKVLAKFILEKIK